MADDIFIQIVSMLMTDKYNFYPTFCQLTTRAKKRVNNMHTDLTQDISIIFHKNDSYISKSP